MSGVTAGGFVGGNKVSINTLSWLGLSQPSVVSLVAVLLRASMAMVLGVVDLVVVKQMSMGIPPVQCDSQQGWPMLLVLLLLVLLLLLLSQGPSCWVGCGQ